MNWKNTVGLCVGLLGVGVLTPRQACAQLVPSQVHQEGVLLDNAGNAIAGPVNLRFQLFAGAAGGAAAWTETYNNTVLVEGYYSLLLGTQTPLTPAVVQASRYLQITVNGTDLLPRTQFVSVPFALVTASLYGGPVVAQNVAILVNGVSTPVIDATGRWVGNPTGLVGPVGPAGPAGAAGVAGIQGPQGPVGPVGPAGAQGIQGLAGPVGPQGVAGPAGAAGAAGAAGLNGSPDTPAQVMAKLIQVDGAGSTLDADVLDGLNSTAFLRKDRLVTDLEEMTSRLGVRAPFVNVGTTGYQTGVRFLDTGVANAGLRFQSNVRTLYVESANAGNTPDTWFDAAGMDLEVRNGAMRVNGSAAVRDNLLVTAGSATVSAGNVLVNNGFVQPSPGAVAKGIQWANGALGVPGDQAALRYIQWGGAGETALDINVGDDGNDRIYLTSSGGVDVRGSGDLRVARNGSFAGEIQPSLGAAGIHWPSNQVPTGDGEDAWMRWISQNGADTMLQIGVNNDSNDEIELFAGGRVRLNGPNGPGVPYPLGIDFPVDRWGGNGGDEAFVRYYSEGGENTRLEIRNSNDADDDILLNAAGGVTVGGSGALTVTNLVVTGNCVGCVAAGGGGGYRPILASAGAGDNGIVFPDNAFGGGGDDAWVRYFSRGGESSMLQIGITNDADDEVEIVSGRYLRLVSSSAVAVPMGIQFHENRAGGAGDEAFIRYFQKAGDAQRLQIGVMNDGDDDLEFYSPGYISLAGPGLTTPLGFQFQRDKFGGAGDEAYLRYYTKGGESARLELGIQNDGDDDLYLTAPGGIFANGFLRGLGSGQIDGNFTVGGSSQINNSETINLDLLVRRNAQVVGSMTVNGNFQVDGTLNLNGNISANVVTGRSSVVSNGPITAGGNITAAGALIAGNGSMVVGPAYIQFPNTCCDYESQHKLRMWGYEYSLGMEGSTLRYNTAQFHRWYYGGNAAAQAVGMELNNNALIVNGTLTTGSTLVVNGDSFNRATSYFGNSNETYIQGRQGRNMFKDAEGRGYLRLGAAWGMTAVYGESETLAIGSASGFTWVGPDGAGQHLRINGDLYMRGNRTIDSNGTWVGPNIPAGKANIVGGSCPANQFVSAVSANGSLTCAAPAGGGGGNVCAAIGDKRAAAMAACRATFPNCQDSGSAGVVGWRQCMGCNCDPQGNWAMYCYASAYDNWNCAQCTLGQIQRSHTPCACGNNTPEIGRWCN